MNIQTNALLRVGIDGKRSAPEPSGALWCSLFGGEVVLVHRAEGALEIGGHVLPLGAGGDAALGVAQLLVIFPAADVADILDRKSVV